MAELGKRKRRFKFSFQVLSLLMIMGAVPWFGYQFISEAKQFLDSGQLISQEQFGRSVANTFYNQKKSLSLSLAAGAPLPKTYLSTAIRVDGSKQDWQDQSYRTTVFPQRVRFDGFGFSVAVGEHSDSLYGLIDVRDIDPDYDTGAINGFDSRDHVRLEWVNRTGSIERVALVPQQGGFVAIFRVGANWRRDTIDRFNKAPIEAVMMPTNKGYAIEVKIDKAYLGQKQELRFSVFDGTTGSGLSSMGTSKGFHALNTSSSEANQRLERLAKSVSYIALYDINFQLRAQTKAKPRANRQPIPTTLWGAVTGLVDEAMIVLLRMSIGIVGDAIETQEEILVAAAQGELAQARWSSFSGGGFLVTAAPVLSDDGSVIGIVLVKQSTDEILKLQLNSLQNIVLFSVIGIFLISSFVFFLFWRLAYRVRKLRIETANMVNKEGRLVANKMVGQVDRDDSIGDLARSFSDVVSKLHEQQSFMATMPRTLSHEIKNPLNAISTSLENISDYPLDDEIKGYIDIAKRGLHRIESILSKLSSAANLEQALTNDELEPLDLNHFLTLYCQHQHQLAGQKVVINYVGIKNTALVQAVDYRLEQALDKLLDNAKDFQRQGTPIIVRLRADKFDWFIEVENQGEQINLDEADQLFQSMVTLRTQASAGGDGHFGLGLFVVQTIAQFHKGAAQVSNLKDGSGVCFSIKLPTQF